jgi:hypothetical protein
MIKIALLLKGFFVALALLLINVHAILNYNDSLLSPCKGTKLFVSSDLSEPERIKPTGDNTFDLTIKEGHVYKLSYSAKNSYPKKIDIDTRGMKPAAMDSLIEIELELTLVQEIKGFDAKLFDAPIGKMKYDNTQQKFVFDKAYTDDRNRQIENEMKRIKEEEGED